jgi:hypothetical protein
LVSVFSSFVTDSRFAFQMFVASSIVDATMLKGFQTPEPGK